MNPPEKGLSPHPISPHHALVETAYKQRRKPDAKADYTPMRQTLTRNFVPPSENYTMRHTCAAFHNHQHEHEHAHEHSNCGHKGCHTHKYYDETMKSLSAFVHHEMLLRLSKDPISGVPEAITGGSFPGLVFYAFEVPYGSRLLTLEVASYKDTGMFEARFQIPNRKPTATQLRLGDVPMCDLEHANHYVAVWSSRGSPSQDSLPPSADAFPPIVTIQNTDHSPAYVFYDLGAELDSSKVPCK